MLSYIQALVDKAQALELWGSIISSVAITVVVWFKTHSWWKTKSSKGKNVGNDQEFISKTYRDLIDTLQQQIEKLSEDVNQLEYLRKQNTELQIKVAGLTRKNEMLHAEIETLKIQLKLLLGNAQ
jgi:cell division protein FtsB